MNERFWTRHTIILIFVYSYLSAYKILVDLEKRIFLLYVKEENCGTWNVSFLRSAMDSLHDYLPLMQILSFCNNSFLQKLIAFTVNKTKTLALRGADR